MSRKIGDVVFRGVPTGDTFARRLHATMVRAGIDTETIAVLIATKTNRAGANGRIQKALSGAKREYITPSEIEMIAKAANVNALWLYGGSMVPARFKPHWYSAAQGEHLGL